MANKEQTKMLVRLADAVYAGSTGVSHAVDEATAVAGWNPSTARIYIDAYRRMIEGRDIARNIPESMLREMVKLIDERHGKPNLDRALQALRLHVEGMESTRGTPMLAARRVLAEFGAPAIAPIRTRTARDEAEILKRLDRIDAILARDREDRAACPLASGSEPGIIQFLTGQQGRVDQDRAHVRSKLLRRTKKLVLVDPYFFAPGKLFEDSDSQVAFLASILPDGLEEVDVFHLPNQVNQELVQGFKRALEQRGASGKRWPTKRFHDRIVLHDEPPALYLGTSFNGIGNKLSFVFELPPDDLAALVPELESIRRGQFVSI